jgi:SNF2 family DNA or RNA helicase
VLELRPYQEEAVQRAIERGSLLLALTMGAGKTATAIVAVRRLRRQRTATNGAVFALKSTKGQWVREIARWDPRAKVQVVEGDKRRRVAMLRRAARYHYTILHYECLVNDWEEIKKYLPIDFVIFDEITALKGFTAKRTKHAKLMAPYAGIRIGLSGQPVENRPEELFSIMEVIDKEVLGGFHKFDRTFIERDHWGKPKKYKNLHLMQQVLGTAMYRKSRDDIKEWLPERIEIPMPVVLDDPTMDLHEFVRKDLAVAIDTALALGATGGKFDAMAHYGRTESGEKMQAMGQVMARMLAMRMLSSHPLLLKLSADAFDNELSRWGSQYASDLKAAGMLDSLPQSTAKFDALLEHVEEILTEDPRHKVVIFSYFKPMLAMIGTALAAAKTPWVKITGDVPAAKRDEYIVRFNTDPACRVFLSSDAGAYGVDLNQGSHLLCYDLPWSAGALEQRVSRIDRTNSAFDQIIIGYMFGQDTIEERIFDMLQQKRKVARAFIDGDFDARSGTLSLDLESLRDFVNAA